MSWEVYIEWRGLSCLVGRLHAAERGPSVSFEYAADWLKRAGTFAVDPTSLPLQAGAQHSPSLFGAMANCGPDRIGRRPASPGHWQLLDGLGSRCPRRRASCVRSLPPWLAGDGLQEGCA